MGRRNKAYFKNLHQQAYEKLIAMQAFGESKKQGICLMALKGSNSKNNWLKYFRQLIFKFRRRIETNFSQLSEQLNAHKVQVQKRL